MTADPVHLQSLSAAFAIPRNDGSTFDFSGSWTAYSARQRYGDDGPAGQFPTHFGDRCFTLNDHAHQKFRFAHMTGTLDGQPVQSYDDFAFAATIFNNSFQLIAVPHGGCVLSSVSPVRARAAPRPRVRRPRMRGARPRLHRRLDATRRRPASRP